MGLFAFYTLNTFAATLVVHEVTGVVKKWTPYLLSHVKAAGCAAVSHLMSGLIYPATTTLVVLHASLVMPVVLEGHFT